MNSADIARYINMRSEKIAMGNGGGGERSKQGEKTCESKSSEEQRRSRNSALEKAVCH